MKKLMIVLTCLFLFVGLSQTAMAQKKRSYKAKTVRVKSYNTRKGKRVQSYKRSKPSRRTTFIMPMALHKEMAA
ncbi:MAG: hypothetical protein ABI675_21950 [Chitinophagaceae bacterium]